jgi:hypothetical protein
MKISLISCALIAITPSFVHAKDFTGAVMSGQTTSLHVYKSWKLSDCTSNKAVVRVLTKPQHGKLTPQEVETRIGTNRRDPGTITQCTGKPTTGFRVSYQSASGFRGADSFTIEVTFGNRVPELDSYTITVK